VLEKKTIGVRERREVDRGKGLFILLKLTNKLKRKLDLGGYLKRSPKVFFFLKKRHYRYNNS
jgi:hypothetical protein